MSRIDWLILRRLLGRIGLTVLLVFGMVVLVETLDTWRFQHLSAVGGPLLGIVAMIASASLWTLNTLPVTLLLGAIIGLLALQARRELTGIRASGISVWRTLRAPLIAITLLAPRFYWSADTAVGTDAGPARSACRRRAIPAISGSSRRASRLCHPCRPPAVAAPVLREDGVPAGRTGKPRLRARPPSLSGLLESGSATARRQRAPASSATCNCQRCPRRRRGSSPSQLRFPSDRHR